jgi:hypothetical protein
VLALRKWNRGVRSRPKHGNFGPDDPRGLWETGDPSGICDQVGGLKSGFRSVRSVQNEVRLYAAQILKGAKPADLPVVQSVKFETVINLKTAKMLGIDIPATLLARADEVIE